MIFLMRKAQALLVVPVSRTRKYFLTEIQALVEAIGALDSTAHCKLSTGQCQGPDVRAIIIITDLLFGVSPGRLLSRDDIDKVPPLFLKGCVPLQP